MEAIQHGGERDFVQSRRLEICMFLGLFGLLPNLQAEG